MIRINNLSKIYRKDGNEVLALKNIDLEISKGEIHGIIGLSGAGKSSLIRCINRIEEPTDGEIWINNTNLMSLNHKDLRNMRKRIGMIFQNFNLLNSKTVFENIAFPLRLSKVSENKVKERVEYLLELVGLVDKRDIYPSRLSGGQRQRVGIARALASNPNVLLCDEATSALDPKTTKQILSLLKDINKKLDLTMVVVTHEMEVIKEICSHVTILEGGEIIEEGNTIDIFSQPKHRTTKEFVDQTQKVPSAFLNNKILYLSFTKGSAGEPIISRLIKKFDIEVNILCGNIEYIGEKSVGRLTIEIDVSPETLQNIVAFLKDSDVEVEVIENE